MTIETLPPDTRGECLCGDPATYMIHITDNQRRYHCDTCQAAFVLKEMCGDPWDLRYWGTVNRHRKDVRQGVY